MKIYDVTQSLEPSRREGADGGPPICIYGKIWIIFLKLALLPLLIWRTGLHKHAVSFPVDKERVCLGVFFSLFITYRTCGFPYYE